MKTRPDFDNILHLDVIILASRSKGCQEKGGQPMKSQTTARSVSMFLLMQFMLFTAGSASMAEASGYIVTAEHFLSGVLIKKETRRMKAGQRHTFRRIAETSAFLNGRPLSQVVISAQGGRGLRDYITDEVTVQVDKRRPGPVTVRYYYGESTAGLPGATVIQAQWNATDQRERARESISMGDMIAIAGRERYPLLEDTLNQATGTDGRWEQNRIAAAITQCGGEQHDVSGGGKDRIDGNEGGGWYIGDWRGFIGGRAGGAASGMGGGWLRSGSREGSCKHLRFGGTAKSCSARARGRPPARGFAAAGLEPGAAIWNEYGYKVKNWAGNRSRDGNQLR